MAEDHPYRTQALAGTYHYDPAAPKAEPAATTSAAEPAGRPRKRLPNPAERLPNAIPVSQPVASATTPAPNDTLVLPKMTVPGTKPKLPASLPQLHVSSPVRNVGEGNPFETPKGRIERLIKKYYTTTEQGLAKLTLNSVGGWAARDAAINDSTEQLNDLAYLIELSLATGLEAPEDQKEIRAEYYRLVAMKPR